MNAILNHFTTNDGSFAAQSEQSQPSEEPLVVPQIRTSLPDNMDVDMEAGIGDSPHRYEIFTLICSELTYLVFRLGTVVVRLFRRPCDYYTDYICQKTFRYSKNGMLSLQELAVAFSLKTPCNVRLS